MLGDARSAPSGEGDHGANETSRAIQTLSGALPICPEEKDNAYGSFIDTDVVWRGCAGRVDVRGYGGGPNPAAGDTYQPRRPGGTPASLVHAPDQLRQRR